MAQQDNKRSLDASERDEQLALAKKAAAGDRAARTTLNNLIDPIIRYQNNRFCKRFCQDNRYRYRCTLPDSWGQPARDAIFCEWGNASYGWMLDDLSNEKRLLHYNGEHGARLNDYIYCIANSLPFYERWKDWRFGRKVHVPTYIQELAPEATKIFYALRNGEALPAIAQKLQLSQARTEALCQAIIICLTQRKRLHLLDPPSTISLTESASGDAATEVDGSTQRDIPDFDEAPDFLEDKGRLAEAWQQLTAVEQYVLEAMLIDEVDASDVLAALAKLSISIKPGVAPADTNRQQLYYFRRKTLAKLAELMQ